MMALESDVQDFSSVLQQIDSPLPGFLRRSIKGKSPAEHVFHVFLSLLHDSGQLNDYNVELRDTCSALRSDSSQRSRARSSGAT